MKLRDSIKTAYRGITHAKTRSILTMLGIVIGIASVIILMSIGSSAQALILNQVQGLGSNLIIVIPGANKSSRFSSPAAAQGIIIKTLVQKDVDALKLDPSVSQVTEEVRGQAKVVYSNNDQTVSFDGVPANFFTVRNFPVASGYSFTDSDVAAYNHVAVMGAGVAADLFGGVNPLGHDIRVKDVTFRVVGVLGAKGVGAFGVDQDHLILLPITVAQKQLLGINYFNDIVVQANNSYTIDFVKARTTSILRQSHSITNPDKDDFTIQTQADVLSILGNITSILTIFLTCIAAISLVVGGIGIMNIMFVSVVERTKEIGLRKAVGATNGDILQQFLWESIILTFLGGVIGIAIGAMFVVLVYFGVKNLAGLDWVFSLPPAAILLGVGVSTLTGLVFGLYPARKASLKSPIESLRYE